MSGVDSEPSFKLVTARPGKRPPPRDARVTQRKAMMLNPARDAELSWYQIFMQVSAIAFVVIDARNRSRRADELRAAGISDLDAHLARHPGDQAALRSATIMDVNDTAVRMFGGTDRKQFIGESTFRFFDPLCPVIKQINTAYFNGEHEFQGRARSARLDGSCFNTIITTVMRVPGATHGIWLAAFIDITEDLRQRAALDGLREELAHSSRISMLGEMSASIAHELGQPLSTITLSAAAAARYLDREVPDVSAAREIIGRIATQATRAREVMVRIRAMAARRVTNVALVPVMDLVRESIRFVHHELERSGIVWSLDIAERDLGLLVDQIQIQQVIVNLLINAVQSLKDSRTAHPAITLSGGPHDGFFFIRIADNGPGLAEDCLPRLFESFYSSREEGLGLGLSICRNIIEAHGGSIHAANRADGPGAIFTISIPLPPSG